MMKKTLLVLLFMLVASTLAPFSRVGAESTTGTLPHATDFLTLPNGMSGTTWYPQASVSGRADYRRELKNRGYTHSYLSVASNSHNLYNSPAVFRSLLVELVNDGIKPVVWLTSDTGSWRGQSTSAIQSSLSNFIPQIDDLVNSYCMGIEIDEYWTEAKADEIGNHLDSLTAKPIAVHQLPGGWSFCNGYCDYLIFQYGFGKTVDQIKSATTSVKTSLGKPVVAGEYNIDGTNEARSIQLGDAAVSVGAAGFGNGGTVTGSPVMTLTFSASPSSITSGQSSRLTWTTSNVSSCYGSGGGIDGWKAASGGTETVYPAATTTYYMECWNAQGVSTGKKSAQVSVNSAYNPVFIKNLQINDTNNSADWSVKANMREGDLMYGDRQLTLSSIPLFLEGAEWIRTANDSKSYTASPLATFLSGADITAYVAHDDRIAYPTWLAGWIDTGENIVDSSGLHFSVLRKDFNNGAAVALGPNINSVSTANYSMYVMAATIRAAGNEAPAPPTNLTIR